MKIDINLARIYFFRNCKCQKLQIPQMSLFLSHLLTLGHPKAVLLRDSVSSSSFSCNMLLSYWSPIVGIKQVKWKVLIAQSCPTLCDPMDCSLPGSSVHGILQARMLEWVAMPFSRGSSWPRDWTWVSHVAAIFFTIWATREAHCRHKVLEKRRIQYSYD